jgi:LmbE family N-acetylglucosaminyl deacetylase
MDKIFLSPHFDDVALSCGGMVAMATAAGERVLVVTVCGGLPPLEASSSLTQKIHRARGFVDGPAYVLARREEDRAAVAVLGAHVEWADSLDAIYRDPRYYSQSVALLGAPAPDDALVSETGMLIAGLRQRFPGATIYAPLGAGGHVDHRAVAAAAREAMGDIALYEEFPTRYVTGPEIAGKPEVARVEPRFVETWVRAVLCYRSQLRPLFGDEDSARAAIMAHARSTGGTRIWRPSRSP